MFTDFSKNAQHASEYAVRLAKKRGAALRLVHVYEEPVAVSESELTMMHFHNMKHRILQQLEERREELVEKFGSEVPITYAIYSQDLIGRIRMLFAQPDVKLAIIGLTGSGMANFFLGSNTLNIVQHSNCTILTVPPHSTYRPIKNIVFAYNTNDISPSDIPVKEIKKVLRTFEAKLFILQINQVKDSSSTKDIVLNDLFEGTPHSVHTISKRNIIAGIKDFARENKADLVAIIPQEQDFWESILRTNHTKAMLFRSDMPILSIPTKEL